MYNPYELMWLWYNYHTEKADLIICGRRSEFDEDCAIPVNSQQRQLSVTNARNNLRIIREYCGGDHWTLYEYRKTFDRYKNKEIFRLYEELDSRGQFDFLHNYVKFRLEKEKENKAEILNLKEFL